MTWMNGLNRIRYTEAVKENLRNGETVLYSNYVNSDMKLCMW